MPTSGITQASRAGRDGGPVDPDLRGPLGDFLLSMADDEFVIGFSDSEWTGIAPILEEDVAMSSIAQDELGHARALYELLAALNDDGRDADALAYDREPEAYRHARLLDHPRGDWADTIARRFLYDTADAARLASIGDGWPPLAELIAKVRREERYHVMHMTLWAERLARTAATRERFAVALETLAVDAATVLATPGGEAALMGAGVLTRSMADAAEEWRRDVARILGPLGMSLAPGPAPDEEDARTGHSASFAWLWGEFTSVRRSEPGAAW